MRRLARLAISYIGTPVITFALLYLLRCGRLFAECFAVLPFGLCMFRNEWPRVLLLSSSQTYFIPFPVCFVCLGRMVAACSPLPSATCFSVSGRYPVYLCNVSGLVSASTLAVAICVPFSRAAASLWLRRCFAGHRVIRLWLVPFDNAKLQPYLL